MKLSRRRFLASSLLTAMYNPLIANEKKSTLPWWNWSGALSSRPVARFAPSSEDQLVDSLKQIVGPVRPVGAGHSFSPLVPTDGTLVVLDKLNGLISHDRKTQTALFAAGTRLGNAGPLLESVGQAMFNLPDIDRQTLAGAISTSTHGTGRDLGSLSSYVTELRLVTPNGEVLDLGPDQQPDLFNAARVSLGSLGIISRIGFQNRDSFNLRSSTWVEDTESVIESFNDRCNEFEHYEFMPLVHADYSLVIAHKETKEPVQPPLPEDDAGGIFGVLSKIPVIFRRPLINYLLGDTPRSETVEPSHLALTNVRNDRFNEMEYSLPVDAGPQCVREILKTVTDNRIDVLIPLEYRIIAKDNTWLGMFSDEPRVSISIHRMAGYDYKPYFDVIEPIFWKYDGRPHWGKVHSLGFAELSALYPRLKDFVAIQKTLDPNGQMLNQHLKKVLGIIPS